VIDDKADDRALLRRLLESRHHDVLEVTDGETALASYREHPADLVLLDLELPKKGGSQTLIELVREFPDVKILVTARGGETISTREYLDIAHDHGIVRALPKPFSVDHFLRAVRVMLEGGEWKRNSDDLEDS